MIRVPATAPAVCDEKTLHFLLDVASKEVFRMMVGCCGSDEIKPSSAGAFVRLANILQQTDREIRIEGHTDNVPIHNARFSSNWDLSAARATATVRLLIQSYSLRPELLGASGYAEYRPVANNDSPQGRAANRRVDIVIPRKH